MKRLFDLLSAPIQGGDEIAQRVSLPWKNPRDFTIEVAQPVRDAFMSVEGPELIDGCFCVTYRNIGVFPCRFAAIVTCDTDEEAAQIPVDHKKLWPLLCLPRSSLPSDS